MTDDLIERLDEFVIRLLDDAEAGCEKPASGDTNKSEDSPGAPVSMTERVAALKAATAYLQLRGVRNADKGDGTLKTVSDKDEPEIVRLSRSVNRRKR